MHYKILIMLQVQAQFFFFFFEYVKLRACLCNSDENFLISHKTLQFQSDLNLSGFDVVFLCAERGRGHAHPSASSLETLQCGE